MEINKNRDSRILIKCYTCTCNIEKNIEIRIENQIQVKLNFKKSCFVHISQKQ